MPLSPNEVEDNVQSVRSDEDLVADCLRGVEEAWSELVDKYKNLIYSIPIKYGFSRDEAADIFQEVCLGLLSELKNVREPKALPKWIIMVTSHKCYHWKAQRGRLVSTDSEQQSTPPAMEVPAVGSKLLEEAEAEQGLREAISSMPPRCKKLIEMLFYEDPARPYKVIAESLGIATGSIGFIRQRCLDRLRTQLKIKIAP
ncbi:MAG TPA: sigma-70 family RNA polymerase sigma factor [Candidatus Acidoferrales bacterium]